MQGELEELWYLGLGLTRDWQYDYCIFLPPTLYFENFQIYRKVEKIVQ